MGISAGPKITTDGLVLHIDATNNKSYSGSGITIFNMVTGGIAGTLVNGSQSDVAYKKTFLLDGTNDTIQMQLPSGIVTGSPITVSLWAKWKSVGTSTTTIQTLVDNQYQVADNIGFFIQDRPDLGSVLEWTTQPNLTVNRRVYSTQVVGDGSWHHIVGTNDGTYSRLYVDGYETGTAKTSAGIATTQDMLSIGNWAYVYSSPRYLNGSVSNFKVYNRALSSSEILTDYFSTKNRFFPNENIVRNGLILNIDASKSNSYSGTGNTIYDLSGSGNTGFLTGGPTFSGLNAGSIVFDGSNDYIDIPSITSITGNFTVAVWFFTTATTDANFKRLVDLNYATGFWLGRQTNTNNWGGGIIESNEPYGIYLPFTNGQWHYLVSIRSGSTHILYGDGVSNTISNTVSTGNLSASSLLIAKQPEGGGTFLNGNISQVQLYNRALSATEVMQNFNAMRERYNI